MPLIVLSLLGASCVDARTAANNTAGFISRTADPKPRRSPQLPPAADVVGFVDVEVTITEVTNEGPVSAFGMRWMATPIAIDPLYIYDLPGVDGEIVGELQPWDNNFWVAERVRFTDMATWRRVTLPDGTAGWTPATNLFAQPQKLTRSDKATIRSLVSGVDLAGSARTGLSAQAPIGIHVDVASEDGQYQVLVDWSGREIKLLAVYSSPVLLSSDQADGYRPSIKLAEQTS